MYKTKLCLSIASLEWSINLEIKHNSGHRPGRCSNRYNEAREAQHLQAHPPRAPPPYLLLRNVHLHREINRQRPKPERPENPHHIIEKRQQHRNKRRDQHKHAPPHQPAQTRGARRKLVLKTEKVINKI